MATHYAEIKGIELELDVTGDVVSGGSNRFGSDDPEWADIENIEITFDGRKPSRKVLDLLDMDAICDAILEEQRGY